ncbi:hypothetical protein I6A62_21365, partial [Frankia sp. AgW1.1]|nr:hypothetical protein [Frankia sp. AgW1.1]
MNERTDERTDSGPAESTCAYPGCEEPTAPPPATGGPAPRYCARPDHTAQTAFRARRGAGRRAAAAPARPASGDQAAERPASLAGASLRETVARLGQLLADFEASAAGARELLDAAVDPAAVEAELAAVRADAPPDA